MLRGVRPSLEVTLTREDRAVVEERAKQRVAPYVEVVRAKAILMMADGKRNVEIADMVDVDARTISIWRKDFRQRGIKSLSDRPRSGRKARFSPYSESGAGTSGLPEARQ
jgi:transposase